MSESGNKIRVLLVGPTGSGKSSTGNTILSGSSETIQSFFGVSTGSDPNTHDNEEFTREILGKSLTVVDTPGADNIRDDPVQIQKEIREAILSSKEDYDAIVLVIRLFRNSLKMTEEELNVIDIVKTILGEKFWDHDIFLFTYGNNYDRLQQEKREEGGINYPEITFDEFVRKNKLARNKYAIGRYAEKTDFAAVKFENNEENVETRKEMAQKFLDKVDEIITRNNHIGYGKNMLPEEQFKAPSAEVRMWQNFVYYLKVRFRRNILPRFQGPNGLSWSVLVLLAILVGVLTSGLSLLLIVITIAIVLLHY